MFKRVFDTDDGRQVLAEMKEFCLFGPGKTTLMVSPKSGLCDPYITHYNEGKRVVLGHIMGLISLEWEDLERMRTMEEYENRRDIENEVYNS